MVKVLGVKFVPWEVPLQRRLQMVAILQHTALVFLAPLITLFIFFYLLFSSLYWIPLGYVAWMVYDCNVRPASSHGGRQSKWLRQMPHMKYFRDYFPISLVKTVDLDPSKNYIFGHHPHGLMVWGAFCNFASDATGFSEKFPGIKPHLITLKPFFWWPFLRGYLLWMGCCDASKESIDWIMKKQGQGNAAVVVIGGVEEMLAAHPNKCDLTLKNRKGFVKMAIRGGADLVPMFSFGENDVFETINNEKGSRWRTVQDAVKRFTGLPLTLFVGRGIFNYSVGILPHRIPITTVVGKPIPVERCSKPTAEMIDKYHQIYMDKLMELYEEHKANYGVPKGVEINYI